MNSKKHPGRYFACFMIRINSSIVLGRREAKSTHKMHFYGPHPAELHHIFERSKICITTHYFQMLQTHSKLFRALLFRPRKIFILQCPLPVGRAEERTFFLICPPLVSHPWPEVQIYVRVPFPARSKDLSAGLSGAAAATASSKFVSDTRLSP